MIELLEGPVVVLFSGGRDSTCLLDLAVQRAGPVTALHVNYGLRAEADEDEAHCEAMCERLGVPLRRAPRRCAARQRPGVGAGGALRTRRSGCQGAIAVGHTATDQAETVLYRLIASPGRRALLGMPARSGRVIRPLLGFTREETAAYCRERGLEWREDATNAASARGRIREILDLHPAAEANVVRTLALLRDEAEVLDLAVDAAVDADLASLPPALARLVLQRMAGDVPIGAHADAILALARKGGTASLDLPGGLRATSEYGRVTIARPSAAQSPAPATPVGARRDPLRRRRRHVRGGRGEPDGPRADLGGARVAAGRPDAARRPGRHQVPPGPVHRPQGPARAPPRRCPWWSPTARSRGSRAWRPASASAPRTSPATRVRLDWRRP